MHPKYNHCKYVFKQGIMYETNLICYQKLRKKKVYEIFCTEQIGEDLARYVSVANLCFIDENVKNV